MAQFKKAAKRRLERFTPSNSGKPSSSRGETFRNLGNKAGKGLHQQRRPTPDSGDGAETGDYMAKLKAAKKSKPKMQNAAARKVHQMKMGKGRY